MNQLKKIAGKIFGKKGSKKTNTPIGKFIKAKLKIIKYAIVAGVTSFFAPIIVTLAVVAFFIGFVQENTDRIENLLRGGCLFCSNEELEEMKENQFYTKIRIIKQSGGDKIDDVVLASTILFLGQYNDMMDSLYDEDFDEEDFGAKVTNLISSLSITGSEGYNGISQEQIDLLDAATIIMINSNVDGKYNEESYKKALASPGFGSDNWFINGATCIVNAVFDVNGILQKALPLISFVPSDGNLADKTIRFLNTIDICSEGFIGGAIDSVKEISDPDAKQRKKEQVAQEIIDFSKFYRSLFPELATNNTAGSVCYYKVPYIDEEISNLKVQTIQCESGNVSGGPYDDISTEGLIDFENIYIPGVVYAEFGGADEETMKTQAVATRSYALTRHMPGANIGITLEDGQWVLRIRTCTSDQVFCHPVLGCHSITGSMQGTTSGGDTVYAGADDSGNYTRQPLADDNPIYERVEATKGEVAVDSSGTVVNTGFVSTDQNAWASMAAGGMNYKNIIINYYSDKGVSDVKSDCRGGGNGIYTTEQLEEYVQLSNAASVTRNHASVDLASSEYGSIEVFNQHIKDNVNNAGYGTRQAVVAAGVSFVGDYIRSTGKRIRYDQRNRQQPSNEGIVNDNLYLDCSSFAWWSLYNAGFKLPCYAQTDYMYFWARGAGYVSDIRSGQAGDYLLTKGKGHIMLIIGTYEDGYYVAHAAGWSVGVKIDKIPYSYLSGGYVVVNMEDYYNNSDNLR